MSYVGIDYGLGRANVDKENGIRYGVISQNSVMQAWADSAEADYGDPTCPNCGSTVYVTSALPDGTDTEDFEHQGGCSDYACTECKKTFDSSAVYGDEPVGWNYDDDGYVLIDCLDNDIMIIKSPFYTHAQFCSPCVPGAGNIDNPMEDGIKTYCLGHDWFDDGSAPYPVYKVDTDEIVKPAATSSASLDGTSGQDRDSYSDEQDRDSYTAKEN